jgi:hypothetical protein
LFVLGYENLLINKHEHGFVSQINMANVILGIGSRVRHSEYGVGVVINFKSDVYVITFVEIGTKNIKVDYPFEILEVAEPSSDMVSLFDVERNLSKILQRWMDATEIVPLGDRWKGGKMILQPGRRDLQSKEIPIDAFFHKIVMMRDRLRVLEQRVNASNIEDEEKVNIQQYITRCYGSMTTFNILFKEPQHHFSGEKLVEA